MNIERAKSVVLILLVSLSLILTWGLWNFQPQYDFVQSTKHTQNVTIGEKRQFNEVIRPAQFIYHQKGHHLGLTNYLINNELYKMVMDLNVTEIEHIRYSSEEHLKSFLQQDGSLEMVFPVDIPMELSNYIMGPLQQDWEIEYFDRIALTLNNRETSLSFVSSNNEEIIKMKVEDTIIENIKQKIGATKHKYPVYFTLRVANGEIIYLPEKQVDLDQLTFSTENILIDELKNALFNDPSRVKQNNLINGEESFTDGSKALEITDNHSMMRFINPANQDINSMESEEMILKSIEFINDHSGWTDSFSLMDWNKNEQILMFGLTINGYPVFDLNDQNRSTSIYQSWRDSELYEYQRSLINLRFSLENESKQTTVPSGRALLSYLAQAKPGFNLDLLENALIGFDYSKEKLNSTEITVQPRWFIKYAGSWEEVHIPSAIIDQGGNSFGME